MGLSPVPVSPSELEPKGQPILAHTGPRWTLAQRLAFRFAFVYLVLYILPFPINALDSLLTNIGEIVTGEETDPDKPSLISRYVTKPYADFVDDVVLWTGSEVFGVEIEYRQRGSGDTTWNYVQIFDFAVSAVALTLLWTLAAWAWGRLRRRPDVGYPLLHEWLRIYVRFYLAQMMVVYGSVKVIQLQFPYPRPEHIAAYLRRVLADAPALDLHGGVRRLQLVRRDGRNARRAAALYPPDYPAWRLDNLWRDGSRRRPQLLLRRAGQVVLVPPNTDESLSSWPRTYGGWFGCSSSGGRKLPAGTRR